MWLCLTGVLLELLTFKFFVSSEFQLLCRGRASYGFEKLWRTSAPLFCGRDM